MVLGLCSGTACVCLVVLVAGGGGPAVEVGEGPRAVVELTDRQGDGTAIKSRASEVKGDKLQRDGDLQVLKFTAVYTLC